MKTKLFLLFLFGSFYSFTQDMDIVYKDLLIKNYSLLTTNYYYKTNYVEGYYTCYDEKGKSSSGMLILNRPPIELIGTIYSNNICEVFYKNKLTSSNLLDMVEVGKLRITWKMNYKTNYASK